MSNPYSFPDLTQKRNDRSIYADFLIQKAAVDAGAQPNLHVEYRSETGAPTQALYLNLLTGRTNTTFAEQQEILFNNPPPGQIPGDTSLVLMQLIGSVIQITWSPVPLATYYIVRLYLAPTEEPINGTLIQTERIRIPSTQLITSTGLADSFYYYASVQAQGTGGEGQEVFTANTLQFFAPPAASSNIVVSQTGQKLFTVWNGPPTGQYYSVEWFKSVSGSNSSITTQLLERQFPISNVFATSTATPDENGAFYFARIYAYAGNVQGLPALSFNAAQFWAIPSSVTNLVIGDYPQTNSIFASFNASPFASSYRLTFFENSTINFNPLPSTIFEVQIFSTIRNTTQYTKLTTTPLSLKDNFFYFATVIPFNNGFQGPKEDAFSAYLYNRIRPSSVSGAFLNFTLMLPPTSIYTAFNRPQGITSSFTTRYKITYYQNGIDLGSNLPVDPTVGRVVTENYINAEPTNHSYTDFTTPIFLSTGVFYYSLIQTFNQDVGGPIASTQAERYLAMPDSPSPRILQFGSQIAATFPTVEFADSYTIQFYQNTTSTFIADERFFWGDIVETQTSNLPYLTVVSPLTPTNDTFYFASLIANNSTVHGIENINSSFVQYSEIPGAPIANLFFSFLPNNTSTIINAQFTMLSNVTSYDVTFYSNDTGNNNSYASGILFESNVPQATPNFRFDFVCPSTVLNGQSVFMTVQAKNNLIYASSIGQTDTLTFYRKPSTLSNASLQIISNVNPAFLRANWQIIFTPPANTTVTGYRATFYDNGYSALPVVTNTILSRSTVFNNVNSVASSNLLMNGKYYWARLEAVNNTVLGDPVDTPVVQYLTQPGQPTATITFGNTYINGIIPSPSTLTVGWINMDPAVTGVSTVFYAESPNASSITLISTVSSRPVPTFAQLPFNTTVFSNLYNYYAIVTGYNGNVPGIPGRTPNFTYYKPPLEPINVSTRISPDLNYIVGLWNPVFNEGDEGIINGYNLNLFVTTPSGDELVNTYEYEGLYYETAYTFVDTLDNLSSYYFTIQAVNHTVGSLFVRSQNNTTFYAVPSTPTNVGIALQGYSTLLVTWTAPNSYLTSFAVDIYRTQFNSNSSITSAFLVASYPDIQSNVEFLFVNPTLQNSSNYFASVRAINNIVSSPVNTTSNAIKYWAPPSLPANFAISLQGESTLRTNWTTPVLFASTYVIDYYSAISNVSTTGFTTSFIETRSNILAPPTFASTNTLEDGKYYFGAFRAFNNGVSSARAFTRNNVRYNASAGIATGVVTFLTNISSINSTWTPPLTGPYTGFIIDFYGAPTEVSTIADGFYLETRSTSAAVTTVTASTFNLVSGYYYYSFVTTVNNFISSSQVASGNAAIFYPPPGPITTQVVSLTRVDSFQYATVFYTASADATRYDVRFYDSLTNVSTVAGTQFTSSNAPAPQTSVTTTPFLVEGQNSKFIYTSIQPFNNTTPGDIFFANNAVQFFFVPAAPTVTLSQICNVFGLDSFSTTWVSGGGTLTGYSTFLYRLDFPAPALTSSLIEQRSVGPAITGFQTTATLANNTRYYTSIVPYNNTTAGSAGNSAIVGFFTVPDIPQSINLFQWHSSFSTSWAPGATVFSSFVLQFFSVGNATTMTSNLPGTPILTSSFASGVRSFQFVSTFRDKTNYAVYMYNQNSSIRSVSNAFTVATVPYYGIPSRPSSVSMFLQGSQIGVNFFTPIDYTSSFPTSYSITIYNNGNNPTITPGYQVFESATGCNITANSNQNIQIQYVSQTSATPAQNGFYFFAVVQFQNNTVSSITSTISGDGTDLVQFLLPPDAPNNGRIVQSNSSIYVTYSTPTTGTPALTQQWISRLYAHAAPLPPFPYPAGNFLSSVTTNSPLRLALSSFFISSFVNRSYYTAYGYGVLNTLSSFPPGVTSTTTNIAFQYLGIPGAPTSVVTTVVGGTAQTSFRTAQDFTSSFATNFALYLWDNGASSFPIPNPTLLQSNDSLQNTNSNCNVAPTYSLTWTGVTLTEGNFYFTSAVQYNSNAYNVISSISTVGALGQYTTAPSPPAEIGLSQIISSIQIRWSTPQNTTSITGISTFTILMYCNANPTTPSYTNFFSTTTVLTPLPLQSTYTVTYNSNYFTDKAYYYATGYSQLSNSLGGLSSSANSISPTPFFQYFGIPGNVPSASATSFLFNNSNISARWSTPTDFSSSFATQYRVQFFSNNGAVLNTGTAVLIDTLTCNASACNVSYGLQAISLVSLTNGSYYYASILGINSGQTSSVNAISTPLTRFLAASAGLTSGTIQQRQSSILVTYVTPNDGTQQTALGYYMRLYSTGTTNINSGGTLITTAFIPNTNFLCNNPNTTISTLFSTTTAGSQFLNLNYFTATGTVANPSESSAVQTQTNMQFFQLPGATISNAITFNPATGNIAVTFSSVADYTSSVATSFEVNVYSNANNQAWPTGYALLLTDSVAASLAGTSRGYTYTLATPPIGQHYLFATIRAQNTSAAISSLSSVTATNAQYFWTPGIVANTCNFQSNDAILTYFSGPTQVMSSLALTFRLQFYQSNAAGFGPNPPATGITFLCNINYTQNTSNYAVTFPSTFFTNSNYQAVYIQAVNANTVSSSWTRANPVVQYFHRPSAAIIVSSFITTNSNIAVTFSTPTDFTSSFATGYVVRVFANSSSNTSGATEIGSQFFTIASPNNTRSIGYSNTVTSYTIPTDSNSRFFYGAVQLCNNSVSSATFTNSVNLPQFFATLGAPVSPTMSFLNNNVHASWQAPTSTSNLVGNYRVVVYNNGGSTTVPGTPQNANIVTSTSVAAVLNQLNYTFTLSTNTMVVGCNYFTTIQALQSASPTTFSSIIVSTANTAEYTLVPTALERIYWYNNGTFFLNWSDPPDATSSAVTHYIVRIFSNSTSALPDFNTATPVEARFASTFSYGMTTQLVEGTWYSATVRPMNNALAGPVCSTINARQYNALPSQGYGHNCMRNNRINLPAPNSNVNLYLNRDQNVNGRTASGWDASPTVVHFSNYNLHGSPHQFGASYKIINDTNGSVTTHAQPIESGSASGIGLASDESLNAYCVGHRSDGLNGFAQLTQTGATYSITSCNYPYANGATGCYMLVGGDGWIYAFSFVGGSGINPSSAHCWALSNPGTINTANGNSNLLYHISSPVWGRCNSSVCHAPIWSQNGLLISRYVDDQSNAFVVAYKPNHRTKPQNIMVWSTIFRRGQVLGNQFCFGTTGNAASAFCMSGSNFIYVGGTYTDGNTVTITSGKSYMIFAINNTTGVPTWCNVNIGSFDSSKDLTYQGPVMYNGALTWDEKIVWRSVGDYNTFLNANAIYIIDGQTGLNISNLPTGGAMTNSRQGASTNPIVDRNNRVHLVNWRSGEYLTYTCINANTNIIQFSSLITSVTGGGTTTAFYMGCITLDRNSTIWQGGAPNNPGGYAIR